MSSGREKDFYKAVRRVAAAVASLPTLKDKLDVLVRATARSLDASASLVLIDAGRKKLVHVASWGLPQYYLHKGVLDADRSLSEVINGKPVVITDVPGDQRIQYPEVAARAGIVSILGMPIISDGQSIGSIRIYAREHREFTNQESSFVATMTNLASVALTQGKINQEQPPDVSILRQAQSKVFANPSEEEFARILDFYNVEWAYEPQSFPLQREGERITEMFTPDFYLPALDLYIEITTIKQGLVTRKNRKLRLLRQLYPEIKIMLLRKNEYEHFLARYGCGPLAHTRAGGISRVLYSAAEIEAKVKWLAQSISRDYAGKRPILVGVQRGFICFMADLMRDITIPLSIDFITISYYSASDHSTFKITKDMDLNIAGRHIIVVEDIVDTGMTLNSILNRLRPREPASLAVCTLLDKRIRRIVDIPLAYVGFEVQDEFVVGYGLDYGEEYRNLPFIGIVALEKQTGE